MTLPPGIRSALRAFERVGKAIGNVVSTVFLFIFYYSIFALFAIPYRVVRALFAASRGKESAYRTVNARPTLPDFEKEY